MGLEHGYGKTSKMSGKQPTEAVPYPRKAATNPAPENPKYQGRPGMKTDSKDKAIHMAGNKAARMGRTY